MTLTARKLNTPVPNMNSVKSRTKSPVHGAGYDKVENKDVEMATVVSNGNA